MPTMETQPTLQAGGTLNPEEHIYVSRQDVEDRLYSLLRQGEYCNVLSSRQVGKSSTVVKVGLRLVDDGARVVMIDLAGELGTPANAEQWYTGFLGRIAGDLGLGVNVETWWNTVAEGTANQRFLRFFRELAVGDAGHPLVILVDEIDSTLKVEYTDDFFTAIRTMYNTRASVPAYRHTTFCLVGVASPNELIKDRRTTAYNVGASVELRDFDPRKDDLGPLYAAVSPDPATGKRLVGTVFDWTDGHPYLTLRLCQEIVEQGIGTPETVRRFMRCRFRSFGEVESDVHFQQISRFLGHRVTERIETLRLYSRVLAGRRERDEATPRHINLKLAGIVKRTPDGHLAVRNRIYREVFNRGWVRGHLPFDWRQQLRRLGIATVVTSVAALGFYAYSAFNQQVLLANANRQLTDSTNVLAAQRNALAARGESLGIALDSANSARQRAQTATAQAVAAGRRAEFLRRDAEANAVAATMAEAQARREKGTADSLRVRESKLRMQTEDSLRSFRDLLEDGFALRRGDSLSRKADEYQQSGSTDSAMVTARQALLSYQEADDQPKVADAHERIGGLQANLTLFDSAQASFRDALEIRLREQPNSPALANTYEAFGDVALRWGRDSLALAHYKDAVLTLQGLGTPRERAELFLKLARTTPRLRDYRASAAVYDSALGLLERAPLVPGTSKADRDAERARIFREQAVVYDALRDSRRYRWALFQADSLEGKSSWTFAGSGGVGYEHVHGLGIGISESLLYTRRPVRPGISVRGFWSFQDSSWIVSGGPTLSFSPFRRLRLETAADLHLGTTGGGRARVVPGFVTTVAVRSWSAVARTYWPLYARRPSFETSVGVNLGFSPRDVFKPDTAPAPAPASRRSSTRSRP